MEESALPLAGVRVIDFTRLLPGPWCTQVLGDMGADVVKIEQPEVGDYGRFNPPQYREGGVYFNSVNRNKRSIALDLVEDRQTALDLIAGADVLVESFRPDVMKKFGMDYASLEGNHPGLIYCSVNGFGSEEPLAALPGHDLSLQGLSGLMASRSGNADLPAVPTFQTSDYAAAIYAAIGILAAHIRRLKTGRGCRIEVPLYDSVMAMTSVTLSSALARLAGFSGEPGIGSFGTNPRYATYPTRDGKAVTVSLLEARTWYQFCKHIDRPDLIYAEGWEDRHSTHGEREPLFRQAIADFCRARDRDELAAEMHAAGIPICPVYTADEAASSFEAKTRGIVGWLEHPVEGRIPYFRDPLERAGLTDPSRRHAPSLGEHSDELRKEAAAIPDLPRAHRQTSS